MMKSFLPEFTVEEIKELYAESTPCSIILNNSDNWLGLGYETNTHLIMFNPVLIDGYIDDDSLYQYFLRGLKAKMTKNLSTNYLNFKLIISKFTFALVWVLIRMCYPLSGRLIYQS